MSRVFVVSQMPREIQDLSPLENFGKITFVNPRFVFADELTKDQSIPDQLWEPLADAADEFDPRRDYLAIAGDHLQVIQFAAILASRGEAFRVLRYDRQAGGYFPVLVELPSDPLDDEYDA